jgi:tetratricopeptide (TPR) repeat protein
VLIQEAKVADTYLHRYEGQSATPFQWYAARAEVELGLRSDVASYPGMQNKEYARHLEAALANVKEGLELAPHNLPLLSELGSTLSFMGRHTDAVSAYKDLLGRFPDHDDAWVNLGICYYFLNQPEEIRAALSHVSPRCAHPRLEDLRRSL